MTREEARMEKKEAIEICERIRKGFFGDKPIEALTMAIEALQERPKGHWSQETYKIADFNITYFICSNCKHGTLYGVGGFCPHCGADMRESE